MESRTSYWDNQDMGETLDIDQALDVAIKKMADQCSASGNDQDKALKFSQAAYNIAQTKHLCKQLTKPVPKTKA